MSNNVSPIIITGVHRSGTSIIAQLLKMLGLFVGKKLDPNYEALFFQQLNNWLLQLAEANWSYPAPFHSLLNQSLMRKQCEAVIRYRLSSRASWSYMGIWNFLRYRSICNLLLIWGWKDPRSIITLPIWLDIFPEAKVLCIFRNGVDVANSLQRRSYQSLENSLRYTTKLDREWISKLNCYKRWTKAAQLPSITDSTRCLSLKSAFELWEEYMKIADQNLQDIHENQKIIIRYEDFLENGVKSLTKICKFIGLPVNSKRIEYLSEKYIKADRSYAYKKDQKLKSFYSNIKNCTYMKKYGY